MMLRSLICCTLLCCLVNLETVESWSSAGTLSPTSPHSQTTPPTSTTRLYSDNDELGSEKTETQRQQELILETMSIKGAKAIARMEITERAKRAMLAEAVEDQIFDLTERLEGFVDEDGKIKEESREKAVDIAKATKSLQSQYNDIVSGQQSSILDALNAMGENMTD